VHRLFRPVRKLVLLQEGSIDRTEPTAEIPSKPAQALDSRKIPSRLQRSFRSEKSFPSRTVHSPSSRAA
jgi:hypothetical protein